MLPLSIDELVREMKNLDASDLHLTADSKPMVRRRGELEPLEHHELLTPELTRATCSTEILSTEQQKVLETRRHIDMAYSIPGRRPPPRQCLLPARRPSAPPSA